MIQLEKGDKEKMKKRIVSVLLLLALIVTTMGCGKQENDSWEKTIQDKTHALWAETAALNSCTLYCNIYKRAISDHNEKKPSNPFTVTLENVHVLTVIVDPDGYTFVEILARKSLSYPDYKGEPTEDCFITVYNSGNYDAPLYYAIKRPGYLLEEVHLDDFDTVMKLRPSSSYEIEVELETKSYTFK